MKLNEIKNTMIGQFFKNSLEGVNYHQSDAIIKDLGTFLNEDVSELVDSIIESVSATSNDISKTFKRFTEGKKSSLMICEDSGIDKMVLFAAVRVGKNISFKDLTEESSIKRCDLLSIKSAIKQAKNLNDEVYFIIKSQG